MNKTVVIMIVVVLLSACIGDFSMDDSYGVIVNNTTKEKIYVLESYNYPDTSIPRGQMVSVKPNDYVYVPLSTNEKELRKKLKSDTVSIFFFEKKIVDSNSIDEIIKKNLYTFRKNLYYMELKEIYYP